MEVISLLWNVLISLLEIVETFLRFIGLRSQLMASGNDFEYSRPE